VRCYGKKNEGCLLLPNAEVYLMHLASPLTNMWFTNSWISLARTVKEERMTWSCIKELDNHCSNASPHLIFRKYIQPYTYTVRIHTNLSSAPLRRQTNLYLTYNHLEIKDQEHIRSKLSVQPLVKLSQSIGRQWFTFVRVLWRTCLSKLLTTSAITVWLET
jgi:hypothetical protein